MPIAPASRPPLPSSAPRTLLLAAVLSLLAGCAGLSNSRHADAAPAPSLPASWSDAPATAGTTADAAALAGWWRGFGDPVLSALVEDALVANLDLRQARATLAQSRALRDVAAAGRSVQLTGSGSSGRTRSDGAVYNSHALGLDASWEADVFGALRAQVAAADASVTASAATLAATRLTVAGDVAQAYLQWQGYRERLQIARDSLAAQEETLQLTQWQSQAGLASALDVEQARTSVEQTRAEIPSLQASLQQTEHQLALLLAQAPGTVGARLAAAGATPQAPAWPALGVPADLLRRRPDVVAAEATARAALATLAQREAERLPSFAISGSLGLAASTVSALTSGAGVAAAIAASVSWPLLDGGAARAQVAAQQAVLDSAQAAYQAAVLGAAQDVEDVLVALRRGREQVASLQRARESADEALALARLRYRAGLIAFTTLLDTQRTALTAATSLASARTSLQLNQVLLYKALGGGWPDFPTLAGAAGAARTGG